MHIRPYTGETDYTAVSNWITDRRSHFLWCAGRFDYPLSQENFYSVISRHAEEYGDVACKVVDEEGLPTGFFVYNINGESKAAFLKFVVLNNALRGKGLGRRMMSFIADYLFAEKNALSVGLVVFDVNTAARRCYENAGFVLVSEESDAFTYENEKWGRCRMAKQR